MINLEEHRIIGERLFLMRNKLGELARSSGLSKWERARARRAQEAVDRLRSLLDDRVCREFPDLPDEDVVRVYYPGGSE